jgi:hypothetical protein
MKSSAFTAAIAIATLAEAAAAQPGTSGQQPHHDPWFPLKPGTT